MTRQLAALVLAAALLAACGEPAADSASPGSPDEPTSTTAPTTPPSPAPSTSPSDNVQVVTPKPGTIKPRAIAWQEAKAGPDGRSVRIFFTSGVEPCHVLDHVKVNYLAERIIVTIYEGTGRDSLNQACIEIAVFKAVDVRLDQPVGKRTFGDGAPG